MRTRHGRATPGRRRVKRTVTVTYPAQARATCAQADVTATRPDGKLFPLLRENRGGRGRGVLLCPDGA